MIRQIALTLLMTVIHVAAVRSQETTVPQRDIALQIPRDVINDVDQAAVALHPATPYLEASTMLLGELDLAKVDVEAAGKWWGAILMAAKGGDAAGGRAQMNSDIAMMKKLVDSMREAGVKHLYASVSTRSVVDGGAVVIIPCEKPSVVKGLVSTLIDEDDENRHKKIHAGDEIVLVGPGTAVDRLVAREGVERPDLILPLRRSERLDHHIIVALPEEARRELAALWPDQTPGILPIQFSPRAMAQDAARIMITWRLPPEPQMMITIETPDADAMSRVEDVLKKVLALAPNETSSVEMESDNTTIILPASPKVFADLQETLSKPMRQQAQQRQVTTTMKQIGLAIHSYRQVEKKLPQSIRDGDGNRLHSVLVALLPYIQQRAMHEALRMDEAWTSDHNQPLTSTRIPLYCETPRRDAKTRIRFPVYPGSLWSGDGEPKSLKDVTDGTSATIAAIHAPESAAVDWADPDPWVLSEDDPKSDIFGDRDRVTVVLLDGAALVLDKATTTNEMLRAMLTIAGGELIER